MPYQSEDDPLVETLNDMLWSIIGVFVGALAAVGIYTWQKKVSAPKFPEILEVPSAPPA
ncbi:MAG: hypothetical protein GX579_08740, partial [Chloroflexi bacterium]|nr:hypothetical protein [Chloroflexota bacterium]